MILKNILHLSNTDRNRPVTSNSMFRSELVNLLVTQPNSGARHGFIPPLFKTKNPRKCWAEKFNEVTIEIKNLLFRNQVFENT